MRVNTPALHDSMTPMNNYTGFFGSRE